MSVFKFLKETCADSQSGIRPSDLDALMQKYLVKMSRDMNRYYDSNARCYASINSTGNIFNMRRLAYVLLHEWLADPVKKTFQLQTRDASKNWGMYFTHALMNFANHQMGSEIANTIVKRYNTLAFTKAEKLTVDELMADDGIPDVIKQFVRNFRPVLKNEAILDSLSKFVNKEIDERFNSIGPNRLNVNNKELTIFFQKVV